MLILPVQESARFLSRGPKTRCWENHEDAIAVQSQQHPPRVEHSTRTFEAMVLLYRRARVQTVKLVGTYTAMPV